MGNPKYWIILVVLIAIVGLAAVLVPSFGQALAALGAIIFIGGAIFLYFANG
jgi:hypothetical protein